MRPTTIAFQESFFILNHCGIAVFATNNGFAGLARQQPRTALGIQNAHHCLRLVAQHFNEP